MIAATATPVRTPARSDVPPAAWPLVGRSEELAFVEQVAFGGEAAGVVVAGMPGVGKTRLVREVVALAERNRLATASAVGTEAGRWLPCGALAHLLPPDLPSTATMHETVHAVGAALVARAGGGRPVVAVDDAHLLDDHSAVLLHHLAQTRRATVVVGLRSGEPAPDAVTALWKEELCVRLELCDLSEDEVAELLHAILGAQVERATGQRLFGVTRGNPLYLRELVRGGLESGALTEEAGLWRWRGPVAVSARLQELIASRIGQRAQGERAALEVVAAAEPLELRLLESLAAPEMPEMLAVLEEAELLVELRDGRRRFVQLAHPLYADVLRAQTPPARRRVIAARLAESLEAVGARRHEELLRLAHWRLEAGLPGSREVLLTAAGQALGVCDFPLAEWLARTAEQSRAGAPATLLLAQGLTGQGRFGEADEVLADLERAADADTVRTPAVRARAQNLLMNLARGDEAVALLRRAEQDVDEPFRHELRAAAAHARLLTGDIVGTISHGRALLDDPRLSDAAVFDVCDAVALALVLDRRPDEAARLWERWRDRVVRGMQGTPVAPIAETLQRFLAALLAGRLADAATLTEQAHRAAVGHEACWVRGFAAGLAGATARAQGRVRTALSWLREGTAAFGDHRVLGHAALLGSETAHTLALLGAVEEAEAALQHAEQAEGSTPPWVTTIHRAQARVWVAAARGETSTAVTVALAEADAARQIGAGSAEALVRHDVARLGQPEAVADDLDRLAAGSDSRLIRTFASHARALVDHDGNALDDSAAAFAAMGAVLLAAEAAAQAACAYTATGRTGSALAAAERSRALAARCEGATTPALVDLGAPLPLTRREREIATLAGRGLSNQEIATRLVVSPRTVGNHLHRVYSKLGVAGRVDLGPILEPG